MSSSAGSLNTDRSHRQKLSNRLTSRQRREWFKKILRSQEAIEEAIEAQDKVLLAAFEAGLSYDALGAPLAAHSSTIRERLFRVAARDQGSGESSQ